MARHTKSPDLPFLRRINSRINSCIAPYLFLSAIFIVYGIISVDFIILGTIIPWGTISNEGGIRSSTSNHRRLFLSCGVMDGTVPTNFDAH